MVNVGVKNELSSRPKRSVVEDLRVIHYSLNLPQES
jgi:hypothetical protein